MDTRSNPTSQLRILSLDGGGIRGKSSLLILENIMERIRDSKGLGQVPRPCEYFDLIGGTSTGGIIAIMLGRLGMTVDECIRAYENVGRAAFTPKPTLLPFAPPKGAFSAKALEAAVKNVIEDNCTEPQCVTRRRQGRPTVDTCPHRNLRFRNTKCTKTIVLAITKANVDTRPTLFTTYDKSRAFRNCTIWEVARATSAATTFFKPIKLGRDQIEFIDAAFGYNNPCEVLVEEAEKQFPDRRQLQILSIGTGLGDVVEIKNTRKSILTALKKMASSSTAVADRLGDRYSDKVPYFRFNVDRGLEDVTLSDWQKTSKISAHTRNYLRGNERAIQKFVDGLLFGPRRQQSDVPEFSGSTSICVHYSIPFFQNTKFTGREGILKILQNKLFRSQDCQTLAIVGLGGVGKTQVVLQFAYWVKQNQPDYSIFWVPAYAEESFEKAYLDIAKIIGIAIDSAKEDPKMTVRNHLSSEGVGRWLLIIDNADDQETISGPSTIYDYLPVSDNGLTVFTTRSSELAQSVAGANQIELRKMDDQEAQRLLENSVVEDSVVHKQLRQDRTLTMELLKELTCLPLAITQAAAYLNQNLKHHHSPAKRYLELLRNTEDDMVRLMSAKFHDHTRYQDSQNAVATTWLVSFEQIRAKDPIAAELLSFVSYIEPKAIPRSLLPRLGSDVEMETAMGTLSGYAFLESRGADDTYDMHSLVHLATRVWVQQQAPSENSYTAIDAIKHFCAIFPGPEPANRQKWQVYFPHAFRLLSRNTAPEIEERYDLSYGVGLCLDEDRRFKEAVRYLEETATWRNTRLSDTDEDRLSSEHTLASTYLDNNQIEKAIRMFEHVVKIRKATLDEKDSSRLSSEHQLARAYLNNNQTEKGIRMLEHIVKIEKITLNEEDYSRLASEHELARAYLEAGQVQKAVDLFEHIIKIEKITLNEEDHSRLVSEHSLGRAYLEAGQVQKAVDLFEHVVKTEKITLNEEDHSRLVSEHSLGRAYLEAGQVQKAVDLFEHVVKMQTTLEEKDRSRLASEHELARAYFKAGQVQKAVDLFEHVVKMKTTLEEKDRSRLVSEHSLGRAYLEAGQVQKAVELLEHVVMVKSQLYRHDDPERQLSADLLREAQEQLEAESDG